MTNFVLSAGPEPTGQSPFAARQALRYSKLFYFFFFSAMGAFAPYFNIVLAARGLTGVEIGWLGSIPPLVSLAAGPFWGGVADRWQVHSRVLAGCALASGLLSLFFLRTMALPALLLLVITFFFFRTPIAAILDGATMEIATLAHSTYSRQRLWGSIGFIVATFLFGRLISGGSLNSIFWANSLLLGVLCTLLSLRLPAGRSMERVNLLSGLRELLARRTYRTFLVALIFLGIGMAGLMNFLGLHILAMGGSERQVGMAFALNSMAEIPIMFFGISWFTRFGNALLMRLGAVGFAVTWLLVAVAQTPGQIIGTTFLIGIFFGSFWVAAVGFADEHSPRSLRSTGQAIMNAALFGLGWSMGAMLGGILWQHTNGHILFLCMSACGVIAAAILFFGKR
ncbi:MAG: MFS transporter [Caldilineaceae bacterium]|nr:MFS transporter [Caldilineaceae bacterium]